MNDQQHAALVHIRDEMKSLNETWEFVERLAASERPAVDPAIGALLDDMDASADRVRAWCEDFRISMRRGSFE